MGQMSKWRENNRDGFDRVSHQWRLVETVFSAIKDGFDVVVREDVSYEAAASRAQACLLTRNRSEMSCPNDSSGVPNVGALMIWGRRACMARGIRDGSHGTYKLLI